MVQRLISAGHRFSDIPDYTLNQVTMFLDAIDREEAGARSSFLSDLAVTVGGIFGGSDQFATHLDELQDRQHE